MPFNDQLIPQQFVDNIKSGKSSLFVGSGLSVGAGLPTWKGLLLELIEEVKKLPFDTTRAMDDYMKLINDPSKYLLLAQDIKNMLVPSFYDIMERRFNDANLKPTNIHKALLSIPFSFVITTNYDRLIEKAFVSLTGEIPATLTHSNSRDIAYKIWNKEFFILKAHGDVFVRKDEIVMTESDYRDILFKNPGFQSALQVIFSSKSIVFIGTSFTDPDFLLLMRYLHTAYHGGGPQHYILISEEEILDVEARHFMQEFKLHSIKYNPENNREQILQFAEALQAMSK